MQLRSYQQQVVNELAALDASGHTRATVTLPCGTGKTVIAAHATQNASSLLVVVPTLELLDQTKATFDTVRTGPSLVVASGGLTDPDKLCEWLETNPNPTVYTTYASFPTVALASAGAGLEWDQVVCDEAHRAAGLSEKNWAMVLDDDSLSARRRTFFTATPKQVSSNPDLVDAQGQPLPVASMDNPELFGPTVSGLTLREAIKAGWLSDYRIAVVVVPSTDIKGLRSGKHVDIDGHPVPLDVVASQLAVSRWAASHPDFNAGLVFCNRVADSRRWADGWNALESSGMVPRPPRSSCVHIDGEMPTDVRRFFIDGLANVPQGELRLVSNCRVLSEGVDVPALDAVVFAQPRTSAPDIVQIVGRCLRPHPNKTQATIIVPVLVDDDEAAIEDAIESSGSGFLAVWQVLTTLAHEDPQLFASLATLRIQAENGEFDDDEPAMVVFDTPNGLPENWASDVRLEILRRTTSGWAVFAAKMAVYAQGGAGTRPKSSLRTADGYPLGRRAADARRLYRLGRLPQAVARHIEDTVPGWDWSVRSRMVVTASVKDDLCRSYLERTGSTDIPAWATLTEPVSGQVVAVGKWFAANKQRLLATA